MAVRRVHEKRSERQAQLAVHSSHDFSMHKKHGQHLLKNPLIIDAIVAKAEIKSTDTVLEIGPGTGNLTLRMLEVAKEVIAVEIDARMVAELQKRVASTPHKHKLRVLVGDVLQLELPRFDLVVANIPYAISSPLTFKLLAHRPLFRAALLMFQREFALRLCAQPGEELYCRLSVNTQLLAKATHVMKVGKNNFRPPPKVESSIVRLKPHNPPPPINFLEWDGFVRLCFQRKNKTLGALFKQRGALQLLATNQARYAGLPGSRATAALTEAEVAQRISDVLERSDATGARANKLAQEDFIKLLIAFNEADLHFA